MDKEIETRIERAIREKVFPGCVIGVIHGGVREVQAFGSFTYESDSPSVSENIIYDVASITKSIPTASLALMLIAEGKLSLGDEVRKYISELQNHYEDTRQKLKSTC